MRNAIRTGFRIAAYALALVSLAFQVPSIVFLWWNFDKRLSCDRLLYWNEWIACLHGQSHLHILALEFAVAVWAIAGVGMALGRFLPWYISIFIPAGMAVASIWILVGHWHEDFRPRTDPVLSSQDILNFSSTAGAVAIFFVGPVVAAWVVGLCGRRRGRLLRLATVFDGAT